MNKINKEKVKNFFNENAKLWVLNGYNDDGYNYPVALHRMRVMKKILLKNYLIKV